MIKEINTHYHNHSQRDSLYKLDENKPAKIEILKNQAQVVSINIKCEYNDNIMGIMCNYFKNLNAKAQAYYDLYSRDKNLNAKA